MIKYGLLANAPVKQFDKSIICKPLNSMIRRIYIAKNNFGFWIGFRWPLLFLPKRYHHIKYRRCLKNTAIYLWPA